MSVLIATENTRGTAWQAASVIAESLTQRGFEVTLGTLSDLERATEFEAVVIGSEVEGGEWSAGARDACRRHAPDLTQRLVWLFSGGSGEGEPGKPADVSELAEAVAARDYMSFPQFDTERVLSWAAFIADELDGHS
ncbi:MULTISPECIES: flavodoxin domain-containing protein [unclassified Rhodococcus (in: high G+C Gram-positive bacteria)]|uniref:flavodoxin domain-containing protein n=1 Tax=Rhodococcus sp. SJ-3 TaxID=3454628 RepID=UPI003F7AA1B5